MTKLELMEDQHKQKMQKLTDLAMAEKNLQDVINGIKIEAEAQHQAKRLDLMLGTGNKMQTMDRAFRKNALEGALSFFASDFGGFSQHSRKMFELTKAAKTAQILLNIPSSVSSAYDAGLDVGGPFAPVTAAAYAAAALASQLGQLRAIQSASFGGGGSSGSSGGSGGGASIPSSQGQQEQAPLQQRFVNIGLSGSDNTMYTKDSVRELIKRLNEEVKDGAVLRVN